VTQAEGRTLFRDLTNEQDTNIVTAAQVDQQISLGQEALNDLIGYFIKDDTSTIALVNGTQEYTLPADCLEVLHATWNNTFLKEETLDEARRNYTNWLSASASATLESYVLYGRKLLLIPKPNATAVSSDGFVDLRYVATPTAYATTAFDGLASQHHAIPIYYAASLWLDAHGFDGAMVRSQRLMEKFLQRAEGARRHYQSRFTSGKGRA